MPREVCRRPHEAPFTRAADCSTCHDVTLRRGAKGPTLAETGMAYHPHHTRASPPGGRCLSCDATPAIAAQARVSSQALSPRAHPGCGACHEAHRFEKGAVQARASCLAGTPVVAGWVQDACTDCHCPHAPAAAPVGCAEDARCTAARAARPGPLGARPTAARCTSL